MHVSEQVKTTTCCPQSPILTTRLQTGNLSPQKKLSKSWEQSTEPCPHHIYNLGGTLIRSHLTTIIYASTLSRTFLDSLKYAENTDILKKPKADPKGLSNYRPFTMLPFPSKVVEKVINKQLCNHLEHHLLDILQSGFCSNHSTETALITVTDDIQTIMDKGETAVHIQLDLSAAFNKVSHSTLITRFHNSRVQGPTLRWLASFLSNRTQQVSLLPHPLQRLYGTSRSSS